MKRTLAVSALTVLLTAAGVASAQAAESDLGATLYAHAHADTHTHPCADGAGSAALRAHSALDGEHRPSINGVMEAAVHRDLPRAVADANFHGALSCCQHGSGGATSQAHMSLSGGYSQALNEAVHASASHDLTFTVAAGNDDEVCGCAAGIGAFHDHVVVTPYC